MWRRRLVRQIYQRYPCNPWSISFRFQSITKSPLAVITFLVKISAKVEYASIAMLELASRFGTNQPMRIRDIAERHGIPSRFLVQILLQLKGAGYVASTRGAAGGYRLVKKPSKVTLGEVMSVIDGRDTELTTNTDGGSALVDVLLETWNGLATEQRAQLDSITLADLLEQSNLQSEDMYYI